MATDFDRVKTISEKYDSRYAAILINVASIRKASGKKVFLGLVLSILNPVFVPYLVYSFFPDKECAIIFGVLDLQESKLVHGEFIHFDTKDRKDLVKSQIYATLVKLKGKKK
jgi:hypothetical protein